MFKYINLFVCLLGISLATEISGLKNSEVSELLEAVKENREYFELCGDILGQELKDCGCVMDDLANLENNATDAVSGAVDLYEQATALMTEYEGCGKKSILKQITCYETVISEAKALIASFDDALKTIPEELSKDVSKLVSDLASCITSDVTSQELNSKMALCKLRLALKN